MPDDVHLGSAPLEWTASPRFELGYRLPSGFGDIALSYRFLISDGSTFVQGPDGPASLRSRLDTHIANLDYLSREASLWPNCGMRWRCGLRFASVYFDSQANERFDLAAAGSGIFATRTSNHYKGLGPHAGVQLEQKLGFSGLALMGAIDSAYLLGRTHQDFLETTTTLGPDGRLLTGETRLANPQTVPVLNLQVGLLWEPPGCCQAHFFLGYEYEYWWDVARISTSPHSRGEMGDQGILFRAEFNF
jgi:hypothetical protein